MLPLCAKNHEAVFVCQYPKCRRQNPFVCNMTGCECHELYHKDCCLISWKKLTYDLRSPDKYKAQFTDIIEQLQIMISNSERNCEILKQEIIKCKSFLNKNEENRAEIVKLIDDSELHKVHKSHIQQYLQFYRVSNEQSKLKDLIVKNVRIVRQNLVEVHKYFKRIYESDTDLINSKIINSIDDVGKFFSEKIKQLKLLYRASDRGFSTERFHQMCDNIPNTILVVQTQFDTVFGGFSPSVWGGVGANEDTSEQSFIFSLTHDEKMEIINPKFSIFNCVKVGPVFGGGNSMMADIEICDRANEVRKSGSNFPVNYNNSKKYVTGQSSIEHLTGQSKGRYFFIKEWEVFSLSFESETEVSSVEHFLA